LLIVKAYFGVLAIFQHRK